MTTRCVRRPGLTLLGSVALVIALAGPAAAPPGDLDPTFDGDGRVTTDFGGFDTAFGVAIQSDGKIVAAGFFSPGSPDFALSRYNPDGSLDPTFDGDGRVTTDFGSFDQAFGVAIQGDGKILAAGRTSAFGDFGLARYNPDGSLDPTFDGDGKVITDFDGDFDEALGVTIQGDGSIVAAGAALVSGISDFALARYRPDGSLDTTFSGDGRVTTDFDGDRDQASGVTIQGDGRIVAGGVARVSGIDDFALARYNPDGSLDTTFGAGLGRAATDFGGSDHANGVAIQGDGKIVAAGVTFGSSGSPNFALARYRPDGFLDPTFDGDGRVITDFGSGDQARGMAIQGDGKIVAAGFAGPDFALARYRPDGSLDTTFSGDGRVITDFGSGDQANAVAIQGDGKIVAAGVARVSGANDFALARYVTPAVADLSLAKTGPPGRVPTGRSMTYGVAVANSGPETASGVTVTDPLPPSVTFVSATPSQGSCSESGGVVTCDLGAVGSGAMATVDIVVNPREPGTITNTASVTTLDSDPNVANNSDSETTSVCRITSRRSSIPCG